MMPAAKHTPVLLNETLSLLQPERGGVFLDATLGLAGHSLALLQRAEEAAAKVKLIGLDQDEAALDLARKNLTPFGARVKIVKGNFGDVEELAQQGKWPLLNGALLDIGVSSLQLDAPERGFSFRQAGPLDMRMDRDAGVDAAAIINSWSEAALARMLKANAEEPFAKRIARSIVERRREAPFTNTADLAALVETCYPAKWRYGRVHPATRTFQALRIEVNQELDALVNGLQALLPQLKPGGRIAAISFHSLEDRIVKHLFREWQKEGKGEVLTKKPIIARSEEVIANPRSRSAKLRGFQKSGT